MFMKWNKDHLSCFIWFKFQKKNSKQLNFVSPSYEKRKFCQSFKIGMLLPTFPFKDKRVTSSFQIQLFLFRKGHIQMSKDPSFRKAVLLSHKGRKILSYCVISNFHKVISNVKEFKEIHYILLSHLKVQKFISKCKKVQKSHIQSVKR